MSPEAKKAYRAMAGYTLIAIEGILDKCDSNEDAALPCGLNIDDLEEYYSEIMNDITENASND